MVRGTIRHLGDAGKGTTYCGRVVTDVRKWTFRPELMTCKRCQQLYDQKLRYEKNLRSQSK